MSSRSLAVGGALASEFFVALTITMTRIFVLLLLGRRQVSALLSPWRRTSPVELDAPPPLFSRGAEPTSFPAVTGRGRDAGSPRARSGACSRAPVPPSIRI